MPYALKKIAVFAKSRKKSGLCIAGKEIRQNSTVGGWIRPISSRLSEEISATECICECGNQPFVLDIVKISLKPHGASSYQCENHLILEGKRWQRDGSIGKTRLPDFADYPTDLWGSTYSGSYGFSDRVIEEKARQLSGSLYLISPEDLELSVQMEGGGFGPPRLKTRACFHYNHQKYVLAVTDPQVENEYRLKGAGVYPILSPKNRVFMCISLGELFQGYCYKLVASIIGL